MKVPARTDLPPFYGRGSGHSCPICRRPFVVGDKVMPSAFPGLATHLAHWGDDVRKAAAREGRLPMRFAGLRDAREVTQ